MTSAERDAIRGVLKKMKAPNLGSGHAFSDEALVARANERGLEAVSRLYLNTWVIPVLEALLDSPSPSRLRRLKIGR